MRLSFRNNKGGSQSSNNNELLELSTRSGQELLGPSTATSTTTTRHPSLKKRTRWKLLPSIRRLRLRPRGSLFSEPKSSLQFFTQSSASSDDAGASTDDESYFDVDEGGYSSSSSSAREEEQRLESASSSVGLQEDEEVHAPNHHDPSAVVVKSFEKAETPCLFEEEPQVLEEVSVLVQPCRKQILLLEPFADAEEYLFEDAVQDEPQVLNTVASEIKLDDVPSPEASDEEQPLQALLDGPLVALVPAVKTIFTSECDEYDLRVVFNPSTGDLQEICAMPAKSRSRLRRTKRHPLVILCMRLLVLSAAVVFLTVRKQPPKNQAPASHRLTRSRVSNKSGLAGSFRTRTRSVFQAASAASTSFSDDVDERFLPVKNNCMGVWLQ